MIHSSKYRWFSIGDISSSATLIFDNLTNMAIISFLLTVVFAMPNDIVFKHIIPGISVGIVLGNLIYMYLAFRLAKKTGRNNVTAFPLGADAPSSIGFTLSVVGPSFLIFKLQGLSPNQAALQSWYVSCACTFFIGFTKVFFSFFCHKIKEALPTVALLSGFAGVAIALIGFFPLLSMLQLPLVSFFIFAVIVMVYFANYKMPANLPAILVAIIIGTVIYYVFQIILTDHSNAPSLSNFHLAFPALNFEFFSIIPTAAKYFSIALPFAFLVVFGTISAAESAKVLGEDYSPNKLMLFDGIATMVMGVFGGTSQTTPYAGFPALKKMDARAGYLLINIIVVGIGSWFGLVNYILALVPEAILAPILLFVGIEIAMQVFMITEKKFLPAAIIGLFPSIARLVEIKLSANPDLISIDKINVALYKVVNGRLSDLAALVTLGNGFIITGILWSAITYYAIERRISAVSFICIILAVCSLFGIVHSMNLDGSMYWFFNLPTERKIIPLEIAGGYILFAIASVTLHILNKKSFQLKSNKVPLAQKKAA